MMKKDEMVVFANQFNAVSLRNFDATHIDILMAVASQMRRKGTETVSFTFDEIRDLINIGKKLSNDELERKILETNRLLLNLEVSFKISRATVQFSLFSTFVTDPDSLMLTVSVNRDFAFLLNNLTKGFTSFELSTFTGLHSRYAKECFRRLKQWKSTGVWRVSIDEFCRLLDVPANLPNRVDYLNKKVLSPIMDELGPLMNLRVEKIYSWPEGKPHRGRKPLAALAFFFDAEKFEPLTDEQKNIMSRRDRMAKSAPVAKPFVEAAEQALQKEERRAQRGFEQEWLTGYEERKGGQVTLRDAVQLPDASWEVQDYVALRKNGYGPEESSKILEQRRREGKIAQVIALEQEFLDKYNRLHHAQLVLDTLKDREIIQQMTAFVEAHLDLAGSAPSTMPSIEETSPAEKERQARENREQNRELLREQWAADQGIDMVAAQSSPEMKVQMDSFVTVTMAGNEASVDEALQYEFLDVYNTQTGNNISLLDLQRDDDLSAASIHYVSERMEEMNGCGFSRGDAESPHDSDLERGPLQLLHRQMALMKEFLDDYNLVEGSNFTIENVEDNHEVYRLMLQYVEEKMKSVSF